MAEGGGTGRVGCCPKRDHSPDKVFVVALEAGGMFASSVFCYTTYRVLRGKEVGGKRNR